MKVIRDYEKYMDDENDLRRHSKKSFKKMKREELYEDGRMGSRKKPDRKK